jgi:hypothetical protein
MHIRPTILFQGEDNSNLEKADSSNLGSQSHMKKLKVDVEDIAMVIDKWFEEIVIQ